MSILVDFTICLRLFALYQSSDSGTGHSPLYRVRGCATYPTPLCGGVVRGAQERTRTSTGFLPHASETCAYASSATSAKYGGPDRDRTGYLFNAIEALYQVSYRPKNCTQFLVRRAFWRTETQLYFEAVHYNTTQK